MNHGPSLHRVSAVAVALALAAAPARAQDDAPVTRAEFNKLQSDVKEQRALIIQLMQSDQQRYDMQLRLSQGLPGGAATAPAAEDGPATAPPGAGGAE
jgi:hypothetical protein